MGSDGGLSAASGLRTASAALLGKTCANAPTSALYALGRSQDIGLQKARDNIKQRNHLPAWLVPVTYRGRRVCGGGNQHHDHQSDRHRERYKCRVLYLWTMPHPIGA
jgi:hypothetical protein